MTVIHWPLTFGINCVIKILHMQLVCLLPGKLHDWHSDRQ